MGNGQFEITFTPVDAGNIELLKTLNRAIFPVNYPDRVYKDILACGDVSQLAFHKDVLVGAIACRLENSPQVGKTKYIDRGLQLFYLVFRILIRLLISNFQGPKLYIITLGVLAPYRNMGVGSRLVQHCISIVQDELPEIIEAYLHVQVNNDEAIHFYRKLKFEQGERIENYYRRIEPPHAVVLRRELTHDGST